MTLTAPPDMQELGVKAERYLFNLLSGCFVQRNSTIIREPGHSDPYRNAMFGDLRCRRMVYEMDVVCVELKGSTHDLSFSLSEQEKTLSVARWVVTKGTAGVWAVTMDVARQHLVEKMGERGPYWVCWPPFDAHVCLESVVTDIQRRCGEIT